MTEPMRFLIRPEHFLGDAALRLVVREEFWEASAQYRAVGLTATLHAYADGGARVRVRWEHNGQLSGWHEHHFLPKRRHGHERAPFQSRRSRRSRGG